MSQYLPDNPKRTGKMTPHPRYQRIASIEVEEWDIDGHHATLSYIDFDAGDDLALILDNLVDAKDFLYDDARKVVITIERQKKPPVARSGEPRD